jgi:hypothetical protein
MRTGKLKGARGGLALIEQEVGDSVTKVAVLGKQFTRALQGANLRREL